MAKRKVWAAQVRTARMEVLEVRITCEINDLDRKVRSLAEEERGVVMPRSMYLGEEWAEVQAVLLGARR